MKSAIHSMIAATDKLDEVGDYIEVLYMASIGPDLPDPLSTVLGQVQSLLREARAELTQGADNERAREDAEGAA